MPKTLKDKKLIIKIAKPEMTLDGFQHKLKNNSKIHVKLAKEVKVIKKSSKSSIKISSQK